MFCKYSGIYIFIGGGFVTNIIVIYIATLHITHMFYWFMNYKCKLYNQTHWNFFVIIVVISSIELSLTTNELKQKNMRVPNKKVR